MSINFKSIKNKIKSYIKETYVKFSVTYFAFLFGLYFLMSSDFISTFKTVTTISLFFYLLFFIYYCIDRKGSEDESFLNKKRKVEKRSFLNKLFYSSKFKFKENEREKLARELKEKIYSSKIKQ